MYAYPPFPSDRYSLSFLYPHPPIRQIQVMEGALSSTQAWLTADRCRRVAAALFAAFGLGFAWTIGGVSVILPVAWSTVLLGVAGLAFSLLGVYEEERELHEHLMETPCETLLAENDWAYLKKHLNPEELKQKFESETAVYSLKEKVQRFGFAPVTCGIVPCESWSEHLMAELSHASFRQMLEVFGWGVVDSGVARAHDWREKAEEDYADCDFDALRQTWSSRLLKSEILSEQYLKKKLSAALQGSSIETACESLWPGLRLRPSLLSKDDFEDMAEHCQGYLLAKTLFELKKQSIENSDLSNTRKRSHLMKAGARFAVDLANLNQRWRAVRERLLENLNT